MIETWPNSKTSVDKLKDKKEIGLIRDNLQLSFVHKNLGVIFDLNRR